MRKLFAFSLLAIGVTGIALTTWNQRTPDLSIIDDSFGAEWIPQFADLPRRSRLPLTSEGVQVVKAELLSMQPSRGPIRIAWEHLRYWTFRRTFTMRIWLEDEYYWYLGYYQRGRFVYLRHYNDWYNVVLVSERDPAQMEELLRPYVAEE